MPNFFTIAETAAVSPTPAQQRNFIQRKLQDFFRVLAFPDDNSNYLKKHPEIQADVYTKQHPECTFDTSMLQLLNSRGEACTVSLMKIKTACDSPAEQTPASDPALTDQVLFYIPGRSSFYEYHWDELVDLAKLGFTVYAINFAGFSGNKGHFYEFDDFILAVNNCINLITQQHHVAPTNLTVYGNCTGSLIACYAVMEHPGVRLIYSSGPDSYPKSASDNFANASMGFFRLFQYLIPFNWDLVCEYLTNQMGLNKNPGLMLSWPNEMKLILGRLNDGVLDGMTGLDWFERQTQPRVADDCDPDFKGTRDRFLDAAWLQDTRNSPRKQQVQTVLQSITELFRGILPQAPKIDYTKAHFARPVNLQANMMVANTQVATTETPPTKHIISMYALLVEWVKATAQHQANHPAAKQKRAVVRQQELQPRLNLHNAFTYSWRHALTHAATLALINPQLIQATFIAANNMLMQYFGAPDHAPHNNHNVCSLYPNASAANFGVMRP